MFKASLRYYRMSLRLAELQETLSLKINNNTQEATSYSCGDDSGLRRTLILFSAPV